MSGYFFDSSALAKRYVNELGTQWIRGICAPSAGNRIFVAQITQVEVMSAVSRQKREGFISTRTARAVRLYLERHMQRQYAVYLYSGAINQSAQDLLDVHPLRASDAIQLASALQIQSRLAAANLPSLIFVSGDVRLLTAAGSEQLLTDDPNVHP